MGLHMYDRNVLVVTEYTIPKYLHKIKDSIDQVIHSIFITEDGVKISLTPFFKQQPRN
jgi:DNA polymerase II large subunit